jgi:hypothetical protein
MRNWVAGNTGGDGEMGCDQNLCKDCRCCEVVGNSSVPVMMMLNNWWWW